MRCTQLFGLSGEAQNFLTNNTETTPIKECPTCHHKEGGELNRKIYASAAHEGMFDDGPDLYEYQLKDGRKVKEIVQAVPWSSGPCIFLCLEDVTGKHLFEWSEEAINDA